LKRCARVPIIPRRWYASMWRGRWGGTRVKEN
jgi:hypothetical protein